MEKLTRNNCTISPSLKKLQLLNRQEDIRIVGEFTLTTNRGYVETVAPSLAKAPSKKTFIKDKIMFADEHKPKFTELVTIN